MATLADLLKKQAEKPQEMVVEAEVVETKEAPTPEPVKPETSPELSTDVEVYERDSENTALVLASAGIGEVGGEIDGGDLIIPRIVQVHNVGDLSQEYDPGTAVLGAGGDTFPFVDLPEDKDARRKHSNSFEFIPLKVQKVYREHFDYNDPKQKELIPREFLSAKEMLEAGGKESYDKPTGPGSFRPALSMMVAIVMPTDRVPEHLVPFFCDEYKGESFCIAMWRLQKSAYSSAGKVIITDAQRALRKTGILSGRYTVRFENQKRGDNLVWCPVASLNKTRNSSDLVGFLTQLVGG